MNRGSNCQLENVYEIENAISENIKFVYDEQAPDECKKFTRKKLHG